MRKNANDYITDAKRILKVTIDSGIYHLILRNEETDKTDVLYEAFAMLTEEHLIPGS